MWPEQFEFLLSLVHPLLEKHSMRAPLSPRLRLSLTLTYLAQGESMRTKHLEFRVGKSTVCKIIPEVCRAIWLVLQPVVLPTLDADGWKRISEQYMLKWQFPNCIGALDGRHMEIEKPPCSGSQYHNYKRFFSMVLLALCDANHKFTWVDIGQFGSISDGGVWRNSELASDLASGDADIPAPTPLPGRDVPFPHVIVADEAFPLNTYLMRPYARRNYCPPDWLDVEDEAGLIHDGRWRTIGPGAFFKELGRTGANRGGSESEGVRNYLKQYFVSPVGEAQAPWQYVTAFQGQIINPRA
ncbi:Nuclease harbi1-like protein [Temnothorax longispinosus]|uniref:Nuclease harbi1-like protein n=1 Tax=Temnothorax longispinosus TaxID=300112 RepID=A0A4S2KQ38_9HYME|nr:Nuclease harbi1-like protein [Temnothorax longispinosus]